MLRTKGYRKTVPGIDGRNHKRQLDPLLFVKGIGKGLIIGIGHPGRLDTGHGLDPAKRRPLSLIKSRAFAPDSQNVQLLL
ncbi:MAG: hypothetical protein Q4G49_17550 [Paracoccus sp. (in: a-proteobacteria)]|nr:hypothetical protein [Paracoccus sp. (in: a-proteobacteria)]